ncbi:MAG: DUF2851 family protein [bacterium]
MAATTLPDMPEVILRRIWQGQNFSSGHLTTSDERSVSIISPGTPNTDAGPDFLNARICIGKTIFHGDVEIHMTAEEWQTHKHNIDPHYNKVILHVVLTVDPLSPPMRTASRRAIPLLVLHPFLDEKFHQAWATALLGEHASATSSLFCKDVNAEVPAKIILSWLQRLASERIELKVRRYEERLKQLVDETRHVVREPYPRYYGNPADIPVPRNDYLKKDFASKDLWEQLLYEGTMEAFGYSRNTKPFLDLAHSMRLATLRDHHLDETQEMMGMLFGAAGLLPSREEMPDPESRRYVNHLKKIWKSARPQFKGGVLGAGDWLFFRLRPNNFPTARLAVMCFLLPKLFGVESFRLLIRIFKDVSLTPKERIQQLSDMFQFEPDDFWKHHYHFKNKKSKNPDSPGAGISLGAARINDIIVNTILPILLLYARIFKDASIGKNIRSMLESLPPSQENPITEIIQTQLVDKKASLNSALLQQGAIQLFRYYCVHARCLECAVGRRTSLASIP